MKHIGLVLLFAATVTFTGCSEDDLSLTSVININNPQDNEDSEESKSFDAWLDKNYTQEYNIRFQYRYNDKETDLTYNVIPASFAESKALARLIQHIWLEVYAEAVGKEFIKTYSPRVIQLIGSYEYSSNGSVVMGTAEKGLKIMLYGVNNLDIDNPRINMDNPYEEKEAKPIDLNYWFFHTMHHEFCHILTQTKNYSTDFQTISSGRYHATDWINVKDKDAAKEGFVTGYASGEYNEDFAEVYANYVTLSPSGWQMILTQAGPDGAAIINKKLSMVKEYFLNSWGVNLDDLRAIILRRSAEAPSLDLRNFN